MTLKTYNAEQVAGLLFVHENRVLEWAASGELLGVKLGRAWVFREQEVEAFVAMKSMECENIELADERYVDYLDEKAIIDRCQPARSTHSIYFLIYRNSIVYIGQSNHPLRRISEHEKTKRFDRFFILPCKQESAISLEAALIKKFSPVLNEQGK